MSTELEREREASKRVEKRKKKGYLNIIVLIVVLEQIGTRVLRGIDARRQKNSNAICVLLLQQRRST